MQKGFLGFQKCMREEGRQQCLESCMLAVFIITLFQTWPNEKQFYFEYNRNIKTYLF